MATITVPDATFDRLSRRAAAIGVTVEQLVLPVLDQIAPLAGADDPPPDPSLPLTGAAWLAEWEAWKRDAASRADRYPLGFRVDDSRESIYREREDAQLSPSQPAPAHDPPPEGSEPLTGTAWWAVLEAWERDAAARSDRYPPGFVLDDSRDATYRERLDAQL